MPRGGKREGAGRKQLKPEDSDIFAGKKFGTLTLERIGELGLKFKDGRAIKTAMDYALHLIQGGGKTAEDMFKLCVAYQNGKPVQPTIQAAQQGEGSEPLARGNLPSHFRPVAGGVNKPN